MNNKKKHAALIIAMIMLFTVIPGAAMADTASAATKLAKPTLTNYAAGSTSIKNTWKKVKGAKGYQVYRATSEKGKYKKIKTITSGKTVSWTNKKLKKNKGYFYKVRAYKIVKGKKKYGKFSSAQWAVATNAPSYEYYVSDKTQSTDKIKLQITNKSRYNMAFDKEGLFAKDMKAIEAAKKMTEKQLNDKEALAAIGCYEAATTPKTIKPGKTVTLIYKIGQKVDYSAASIILGTFKYNKKNYKIDAGWDIGSDCVRI